MMPFSDSSMVGVCNTRKGPKFVHANSEMVIARFTILIFMSNKPSVLENEELENFNHHLKDFR